MPYLFTAMNSLKQSILLGLAFVALLFIGSNSLPSRVHAANVNGAIVEQYKVIDLNRLPLNGGTPGGSLEVTLNALSAEGWQVRAATDNVVILAHP